MNKKPNQKKNQKHKRKKHNKQTQPKLPIQFVWDF